MKTTIITLAALCALAAAPCLAARAAASNPELATATAASRHYAASDSIVDNSQATQPAIYPGGEAALQRDVAQALIYPKKALAQKVEGTVLVRFVVESDGSIGKVEVKQGLTTECDLAATACVGKLRAFYPATHQGRQVPVWYTLPIQFSIAGAGNQTMGTSSNNDAQQSTAINRAANNNEETVYDVVEKLPEYPGGMAALMREVALNLVYPPAAINKGIQGRVFLQFVVETDGSIGEIRVTRELSEECDQAAIDSVRKLKKFKPGLQNGKPVRVWYRLPIAFQLQ